MAAFTFSSLVMLLLLITIFSGCVFIFIFNQLRKLWWNPIRIQRFFRSQGIQGPPYKFMYGNTVEMMKMKIEAMNKSMDISDHHILPRVYPHFDLWINKYGKNILFWSGSDAELLVTDPEMVKELAYNSDQAFPKIELDGYALRILGNGIATAEGEKWAKIRKIVVYAFHGDLLKNMVTTMASCAELMVEKWSQYEGKEVDMFKEFKLFSQDIIAHTAFGSSYSEGKVIFENLEQLGSLLVKSQFKKRSFISHIFRSSNDDNRVGEELERDIIDSITALIKVREEKMVNGESDSYGNDFLGLLLKAKNDPDMSQRISLNDVIDECKTIYFAGNETTTVSLSWTAFLLATHVDWQEEARKEVFNVFGSNKPTTEGIGKLKTMGMIIKESLRLYPPATLLLRKVKKEVRLGKLTIPPNTLLSTSMIAVHHDKTIWGEDAHLFKPDRFSKDMPPAAAAAAYFPFSIGPRNCAGNLLAINEIKIAMSMILQRYSFTISPAHVHAPFSFLNVSPQHGVRVILQSL